jgi:hypothetical protein
MELIEAILAALEGQHLVWLRSTPEQPEQERINEAIEHGVTAAEEAVVAVLLKAGIPVVRQLIDDGEDEPDASPRS